jgi:hypothetical protein
MMTLQEKVWKLDPAFFLRFWTLSLEFQTYVVMKFGYKKMWIPNGRVGKYLNSLYFKLSTPLNRKRF